MRSPRNICSIIGGLAGVPLGGIEGISIQSGGAPPNVPITTKIEIFQSPAPPPPPPPPTPPEMAQFGGLTVSELGSLAGEIVGQVLNPFRFERPVGPIRGQPGGAPPEVPPSFRLQPSGETVPTLDFGFRPQRSEVVTGEVQTLNTGREFRPTQEIATLQQGGHGGELQTGVQRETLRTVETTGQQTLETIEQSRQDFQAGRFVDPPGELDYVADTAPNAKPGALESSAPATPCATCSMLNPNPDAKDSYPVEMIFHFKNHASAQRLGGLCEADGECEIA